ncbi:MAG: trigger factor family protein [Verrucomicrobia bacterium]|nr:MAG: trigger factor family protein [Verrucomicrobiota bacterium]
MKVEVETQPGSVSTLQIELPPEEVSKEWDSIANSFARFARIPGYRPGKAPRSVIEKRFRKEIQDELTKKLVSKSYHDAIEQKQLRVVSLTNLEDVQFGQDKSMRFRATVVTAPEFELPDYQNIPVQVPDLLMFQSVECKWEILLSSILKVPSGTSPSVKLRRRRARTCTAAKNSGFIWPPRISFQCSATRLSGRSVTKRGKSQSLFRVIFQSRNWRKKMRVTR